MTDSHVLLFTHIVPLLTQLNLHDAYDITHRGLALLGQSAPPLTTRVLNLLPRPSSLLANGVSISRRSGCTGVWSILARCLHSKHVLCGNLYWDVGSLASIDQAAVAEALVLDLVDLVHLTTLRLVGSTALFNQQLGGKAKRVDGMRWSTNWSTFSNHMVDSQSSRIHVDAFPEAKKVTVGNWLGYTQRASWTTPPYNEFDKMHNNNNDG